jgi:hypothetical protein
LIGCPETSVESYYSTLRNTPEDDGYHLHRGASLKSRLFRVYQPTLHHISEDHKVNEMSFGGWEADLNGSGSYPVADFFVGDV